MTNPAIGVTTYNDKNKYGYPIAALLHMYITALIEAGGAPVMLPSGLPEDSLQSILSRLDGILLTGGGDIDIERYGGEFHPSLEGVDVDRDKFEIALLKAVLESGKPFFGICRGFQVVNVTLGGTLYTDIQAQLPGALKHNYDSSSQRRFLAHEIAIEKTSHLADILGVNKIQVNSLHHQGARCLAPALQAVGRAPDGLVEAVELPGHPFGLAVQWHPEWLTDQPVTRRLFRAFVDAAGNG